MELNKTEQKIADRLAEIRGDIQAYMDEHIKDYDTRMNGPTIFKAMGDKVGDMKQGDFQASLSLNVRGGLITGYRGVKGKFGGYCPADAVKPGKAPVEGGEPDTSSRIKLAEGVFLASHDSLNWCLEGFGPKRYWPSLEKAMHESSRFLLEEKVRDLSQDGVSVENLSNLIVQAQNDICKQMKTLK